MKIMMPRSHISVQYSPVNVNIILHPDIRSFCAIYTYTMHFIWTKLDIFYVNKRTLRHFDVYHLYFTSQFQQSACERAVSSLFPNHSCSLSEIHGSRATKAAKTIFLFIMHSSIHQISSSLAVSSLKCES